MNWMYVILNVAPNTMHTVVKYVIHNFESANNYVDDVLACAAEESPVVPELVRYRLLTELAENVPAARVLGLQL